MYPNSGDVSLGSSKCAATEIHLSFINKFVNYHSLNYHYSERMTTRIVMK